MTSFMLLYNGPATTPEASHAAGDHRDRARPTRTDDPGQRGSPAL